MALCNPVGRPPRRLVVRLEQGFAAPPELRRLVPERALLPLAARALKGSAKARRPVAQLVEDLRAAHTLVIPDGADADRFARAVASWEGAREVYVEPAFAAPPGVVEDTVDEEVSAEWWATFGRHPKFDADGAGVSFVDVEWGFAEHEALPSVELLYGQNHGWWWHGNAVLGVIAGQNPRARGLAPRATAGFASPWTPGGGYEVARALAHAGGALEAGDVLLVELQATCGARTGLPVEVDPAVADVIALATHAGILVVEAAGNGGHDLGEVCVAGRGRGLVGTAGAVLVGASIPEKAARLPRSNYGDAVDCCAWGDDVATAWSNQLGTARAAYTPAFSGTSAAAAIVAGIAILAQSASKARGRLLSPDELHELVRHGEPVPGVGTLPNVAAILASL